MRFGRMLSLKRQVEKPTSPPPHPHILYRIQHARFTTPPYADPVPANRTFYNQKTGCLQGGHDSCAAKCTQPGYFRVTQAMWPNRRTSVKVSIYNNHYSSGRHCVMGRNVLCQHAYLPSHLNIPCKSLLSVLSSPIDPREKFFCFF